ncbi:MAG: hypothetical protein H0X50_08800 [Nitrosopumilus sp.]|nr:hypothetical protein [Nitrosopumilus sp.]
MEKSAYISTFLIYLPIIKKDNQIPLFCYLDIFFLLLGEYFIVVRKKRNGATKAIKGK